MRKRASKRTRTQTKQYVPTTTLRNFATGKRGHVKRNKKPVKKIFEIPLKKNLDAKSNKKIRLTRVTAPLYDLVEKIRLEYPNQFRKLTVEEVVSITYEQLL